MVNALKMALKESVRKSCQVSKCFGAVTCVLDFLALALEHSSFTKSTGVKWKKYWLHQDHDYIQILGYFVQWSGCRNTHAHLIIDGCGQSAAFLDVVRVKLLIFLLPSSYIIVYSCWVKLSNGIDLLMLDLALNTLEVDNNVDGKHKH